MPGSDSTTIGPREAGGSGSGARQGDDAVPDSAGPSGDGAPQPPNPYLADSSPKPADDGARRVDELDTASCWRLLESGTLGRLAVEGHDGRPDVFPVNYLVHNGNLFIRSAPGAKLRSITKHPAVAFEIDGETANYHWSVVIRAAAHRMDMDTDIEASGVLGLVSSSPTVKDNFIRLTPDTVTGRRFPKRQRPGRARVPLTEPDDNDSRTSRNLKPDPIPHFAPLPED